MRWLCAVVLMVCLNQSQTASQRRYNPVNYPFYLPVPSALKVHQPAHPLGFYQPGNSPQAPPSPSFANYAETNDPGMLLWYQEMINQSKDQQQGTEEPIEAQTTQSSSPSTLTSWVRPRYTFAPPGSARPLPPQFITLPPNTPEPEIESTPRSSQPSTRQTSPDEPPTTTTPSMPEPVGTDIEDHIDLFWHGLKLETKKFANELHPMKEDFDELNSRFATLMAYFVDGLYQRTRSAIRHAKQRAPAQLLRARKFVQQ